MDETKLIGVVLAGGFSTRMGEDKGLISTSKVKNWQDSNSTPPLPKLWVEHQMETLNAVTSNVYVSIREEQKESYTKNIPSAKLILDSANFQGPAAGILSVYEHFHEAILILPCDMLYMNASELKKLVNLYEYNHVPSAAAIDFIGFKSKFGIEPLAGIYTKKGLINLQIHYNSGKGLYKFLENANSKLINLLNDNYFMNFNDKTSFHNSPT